MTIAPSALAERQDIFASSYLPTIHDRCSYRFRTLDADAAAEAEQDVLLATWKAYSRAAEAGTVWDGQAENRQGLATPNSIATFAIASRQSGREALASDTVDVLSPLTRAAGKARPMHLDGDRLGGTHPDDPAAVPAQLVAGDGYNPASTVRQQLDWSEIGRRCTPNARRTLTMLARGWRPTEIAARLKVTPSRVTALKQQIAEVARGLGYAPPSRPFRHNDGEEVAL